LAFVVGSLINVYGQLLVPWFRDRSDPFGAFVSEFDARPRLATFSVWTPRKTLTFGGVTPELASGGLPCRPFGPVFRFLMSVSGVSERVFLYPGALRALSQTRRFIL